MGGKKISTEEEEEEEEDKVFFSSEISSENIAHFFSSTEIEKGKKQKIKKELRKTRTREKDRLRGQNFTEKNAYFMRVDEKRIRKVKEAKITINIRPYIDFT